MFVAYLRFRISWLVGGLVFCVIGVLSLIGQNVFYWKFDVCCWAV